MLIASYIIIIAIISLAMWNGEWFNLMTECVFNNITLRLFIFSAIIAIPWSIVSYTGNFKIIAIDDIKTVLKSKRTKPKASGELSVTKDDEKGKLSL